MRYEIELIPASSAKRGKAVNVTIVTQRNGMVIANATIKPEDIGTFLSMVLIAD